jgi:uncharacterized protein (TIGR02246 family)
MGKRIPISAIPLVLAACVSVPPGGISEESPKSEITQLFRTYSAAVAEGRWGDLAELYADDPRFVWVEDGRVAYRARDEILEAFRGLESQFAEVKTEFNDLSVDSLAPGLCHVTARIEQSFSRAGGETFSFSAMMTATLIRSRGGWRFLKGHTSTVRQR